MKRHVALNLARIAMRNAFLNGRWPAITLLNAGIYLALYGERNG